MTEVFKVYACYIDESGHCGKKYDPEQPVEVVCGVLVDLSKLFKTQREQRLIMKFLNSQGIPFNELKASDIYAGRKHWKEVDPRIRDYVFKYILRWMRERYCKVIACPIDSAYFFSKKDADCPISKKFCYPYEVGALNAILGIQRVQQSKKNNKDKTFLIFDEQKGHNENVLRLLESDLHFTDGYTQYTDERKKHEKSRLCSIIDVPYFSKSHLAIVIQLADCAAFIINKYLALKCYKCEEKYSGELQKITDWYKLIGECLINHTAIDPPGKDRLCAYFKSVRPSGWSAKKWIVD